MLNVNRILFPTDYSESAEGAFVQAVFLAERFDAELHVLHASVSERPLFPPHDRRPGERGFGDGNHAPPPSRIYAKEWALDVAIVQSEAVDVSAAAAILKYATAQDIDLIVMGTHGRRGMGRVLMGSVAEQVVRMSGVPVYTVRAPAGPERHRRPRRILAPVDFSEHSSGSLQVAAEIAHVYDATLEVLHVVDEAILPHVYGIEPVSVSASTIRQRTREALKEMVTKVDVDHRVAGTHVLLGHPAIEIVDFAREAAFDLIVIGTHGRSGLKRLLLGSVAEKVVRMAQCPVFTTKSFGRRLLHSSGAGKQGVGVSA